MPGVLNKTRGLTLKRLLQETVMDMEPFYFIQYAVLVYCIVLFVYGMLPVLKKRIEVD